MSRRLCFAIAVTLVSSLVTAEEEKPANKVEPTRILRGPEYSAAVDARNRADRLRADLQKRLPAFPRKRPGDPAPAVQAEEFTKEIGEVVEAYQDVINHYPHTEIAAYCAMRLAGTYQYQGKFDEAAKLLEKTAGEFAGTREGALVAFDTGLIHAQGRKDYLDVSQWFARVPKPEPLAEEDEDSLLYMSAQQQLIACEVQLDRGKDAEQRLADLKNDFPKSVDEIDRSYTLAVFNTGLLHAEARHDYVKAAHWLARVPKPKDPAEKLYQVDLGVYLSAQRQLIVCELRLKRDEDAERRLTELKAAFPKNADELDRLYKFELSSRNKAPRKDQKGD